MFKFLVFGQDAIQWVKKFNLTVDDPPLPNIDTAEGKPREVAGYVILPVVVDGHFGQKRWLVLSLKPRFILGVDFCRRFGLEVNYHKNAYFIDRDGLSLLLLQHNKPSPKFNRY